MEESQDRKGAERIFEEIMGPGQAAQLVGVVPSYARVVGSITSQGICKNQPINA